MLRHIPKNKPVPSSSTQAPAVTRPTDGTPHSQGSHPWRQRPQQLAPRTPLWEAPSGHPANPPAALQGHASLPRCQEGPGRDPQSSLPQITSESSSVSEGSLPSRSSGPAGAQQVPATRALAHRVMGKGTARQPQTGWTRPRTQYCRSIPRWIKMRGGPVAVAGATRLTSGRGRNLATGRNYSPVTWHNQTGL